MGAESGRAPVNRWSSGGPAEDERAKALGSAGNGTELNLELIGDTFGNGLDKERA